MNLIKFKSQKIIKICEKSNRLLIYFLVFSLPLFFLPNISDVLDFGKQFFLGVLIFSALIFWLIKMLFSGRSEVSLGFAAKAISTFLLANFFSLIFSDWRYSSFWGWPFNVSQGFLSLAYFFIFYFLIINYFDDKKEVLNLLSVLIFSAFLASIFSILNFFSRFVFPWDFSKSVYFNTIGSVNALALFLAILSPLCFIRIITSKGLARQLFSAALVSFLILFFLINSRLTWLILAVSSSVLFIFGILELRKNGKMNLVFLPLFFLIISLAFIAFSHPVNFLEKIFGFSLPRFLPEIQYPLEVSITQTAEFDIIKNSFKNLKNFFFGTGPANFLFAYLRYKPQEINNTQFWGMRFKNGSSYVLDGLVTTGVLGEISLLSMFLVFFLTIGKNLRPFLRNEKEEEERESSGEPPASLEHNDFVNRDFLMNIGILSSFISIAFTLFFYPVNFSLLFAVWFIIAILTVFSQKTKKKIAPSLKTAVFLTSVFAVGIILSFLSIKNYLAEIKYFSGMNAFSEAKTDEAIKTIEEASVLNPDIDSYWRDISQVYLEKLNEISRDKRLPEEEAILKSGELVEKAIKAAEKATDFSPKNSQNWINRGFIYENLSFQPSGNNSWISYALDFYKKAGELDPKNPWIFNEIGQVYLQKSNILSRQNGAEKEIKDNLNKAEENLNKALELKPDFVQAVVQLASVFQKEGKIKEAIAKLEQTKLIASDDSLLAFQLGILYYGEGNNISAKAELERAVKINPNYSNARYFLGLIYAKEGKNKEAIEQFEWIERLNPKDENIKKILNDLKEGKSILP